MQQRILELRAKLNYHNHKYYVENSPEISDFEFDAMMRELQELGTALPAVRRPQLPHGKGRQRLDARVRKRPSSIPDAVPVQHLFAG